MEHLFEVLFELIFSFLFEGSMDLGTNKKIRKPVRILALILFFLILAAIIIILLLITISIIKNNTAAGVMFILFDIFLLFSVIWGFIKQYKEHNKN